jgi:hypothetical protein
MCIDDRDHTVGGADKKKGPLRAPKREAMDKRSTILSTTAAS